MVVSGPTPLDPREIFYSSRAHALTLMMNLLLTDGWRRVNSKQLSIYLASVIHPIDIILSINNLPVCWVVNVSNGQRLGRCWEANTIRQCNWYSLWPRKLAKQLMHHLSYTGQMFGRLNREWTQLFQISWKKDSRGTWRKPESQSESDKYDLFETENCRSGLVRTKLIVDLGDDYLNVGVVSSDISWCHATSVVVH